ncbi:hydroxyethylthiazole kinase [Adlercreutzia murintestinalis]|uniref:hydroxyethylthiazole kinase n=1 Tax=Adlercreutzia murintestinalis TaxID=2941325 RepID=UPI00203D4370|nr:hydroxyethylthiazole kinase [Adlercreutzia murintestinalis]
MDIDVLRSTLGCAAERVRAEKPLAGSVTNGVTMDFVANSQLAAGGSAAMVYLPDEAERLVNVGGALYLNMGTLLPVYEQTIPTAAAAARRAGKPWVVDPVGIGIGALRARLLADLKDDKPTIIRGNASEIIALATLWGLGGDAGTGPLGVDSVDEVEAARAAAVALARWTGGAVAVSGVCDLVTNGQVVARCQGGSALMEKVTGFGCSLGGVTAVYAACADPFAAATAAVVLYNIAGARAATRTTLPASFKVAFIDELAAAIPADIAEGPLTLEEV